VFFIKPQLIFLQKMAGIRLFKSCCTIGTDFFFSPVEKTAQWKKTEEKTLFTTVDTVTAQ
jgi:hypothetical protein